MIFLGIKTNKCLILILLLFMFSFIYAQNQMRVSYIGGFDIPSINMFGTFLSPSKIVMQGDSLSIYTYSVTEREIQIKKRIICPSGELIPDDTIFAYDVPETFGELLTEPYYYEYKHDKLYYAFKAGNQMLIFITDDSSTDIHLIDISGINIGDPGQNALIIVDEFYTYLSDMGYLSDPQYVNRIYKISLIDDNVSLFYEDTDLNNFTNYHFQEFGDYLYIFSSGPFGCDLLVFNNDIIQIIPADWNDHPAYYTYTQNFCNNYYFTLECQAMIATNSVIMWIENNFLQKRYFDSPMYMGDEAAYLKYISAFSDSEIMAVYVDNSGSYRRFFNYQLNFADELNPLLLTNFFPDLSAYENAMSLSRMDDDYLMAVCRQSENEYSFILADFTDESIRSYSYNLNNGYYEPLVYNSDKYLYLLSSNRVSILKLEQETSSDDHIMPSQMNQVEVYPNPFANECKISMKQTNAKILNVSIYNIKGQKIRDLSNGNLKNEHDQIIWDARDHSNQTVASGIYFVKVETEQGLFVKKILKLK